MIESLVGTYEEMPIKPGINVYEIKFNSEVQLNCCFASIAELNSYGKPQVTSARFTVMNTGIIAGEGPNEWVAMILIESSWAGVLKGRIGILCV